MFHFTLRVIDFRFKSNQKDREFFKTEFLILLFINFIYEKFKFSIVNYPDLGGNIAKVCGYGVVKSELKRYAKLSSKFSDFNIRKVLLFNKVLQKGYLLDKIGQIYNSIQLGY